MEDKPLNKIIRETKGNKKYKSSSKDGDKIKTERFGDANMSIKRDDEKRKKEKNFEENENNVQY